MSTTINLIKRFKELLAPIDKVWSWVMEFSNNRIGKLFGLSIGLAMVFAIYSTAFFIAIVIGVIAIIFGKTKEVNAKADAKIDEILNKEE